MHVELDASTCNFQQSPLLPDLQSDFYSVPIGAYLPNLRELKLNNSLLMSVR